MKKKLSSNFLTADAEMSLIEVGRLVSMARKKRKITLIELSKKVGVDRRTLSQLESGAPSVSIRILFQVLSLFKLTQGMVDFLNPENDINDSAVKLKKIRSGKKILEKINDNEVIF